MLPIKLTDTSLPFFIFQVFSYQLCLLTVLEQWNVSNQISIISRINIGIKSVEISFPSHWNQVEGKKVLEKKRNYILCGIYISMNSLSFRFVSFLFGFCVIIANEMREKKQKICLPSLFALRELCTIKVPIHFYVLWTKREKSFPSQVVTLLIPTI